jgi:predicted metalloprotease with PDZ domain
MHFPRWTSIAVIAGLVAANGVWQQAGAQDSLATYSDAFEAQFDRAQPVLRYVIHGNPPVDSLGYSVDLYVRAGSRRVDGRNRGTMDTIRVASPIWAPGAYRVANFNRYVKNVRASRNGAAVAVVREDSSTWRIVVPDTGETVLHYDVRYPTAAGAAGLGNYSFYRPDGALLSGAMTYLYVVGHKLTPVHVTFDLPTGWRIATGLVPTADPQTFFAPSYDVLIDCPVLTGPRLHIWHFAVDGVPHRVAYYTTKKWTPFDTLQWVDMHKRIVTAARNVMGRLPYREYTFIYEDGPGGGLEHLNSATMAAPSRLLAPDAHRLASLTAHEYFHAWNVKRVRPVELGPFAYDRPVRTINLWWAEGVTDFFADQLLRRAGLRDEASARRSFEIGIQAYLDNPGHDKMSPERASWTSWDPNTVNSGYNVSYYTTGGLLGELLDLSLRHRTNGVKGMDDVELYLFDHYAGPRGYTSEDLLNAVDHVCGCDMQPFFEHYVSGTTPFDFDTYLQYAGWKAVVTKQQTDSLGHQLADVRAGITGFNGVGSLGSYVGSPARLSLNIPNGSFGRAGLVDGDFITSVNGKPIADNKDFRAAFQHAKVGDRYQVAYVRAGKPATTTVVIQPYVRTVVRIVDLPTVTPQQRMVRAIWLHGPLASLLNGQ